MVTGVCPRHVHLTPLVNVITFGAMAPAMIGGGGLPWMWPNVVTSTGPTRGVAIPAFLTSP
ncbi:hypothetical protein QJS66_15835 [Kocuria rhizophila]|nr:hypothetical protein QJS66_15835 [Kocuria rhizophila]